jgi:hypothetical protein
MSDIALALAGTVFGATATGGTQVISAWHGRRDARRVAARLLLGDLYRAQADLELVLSEGRWQDSGALDFDRLLATWAEHRVALAGSMDSVDWHDVANAIRRTSDAPRAVRLGQRLRPDETAGLSATVAALELAFGPLTKHSTSRRDRAALIAEHAARRAATPGLLGDAKQSAEKPAVSPSD